MFYRFPKPQTRGKFVRRRQRFLIDVDMPSGQSVVAYCANPGSFRGCLVPGSDVILWDSTNLKRRRRFTWRAIRISGIWVGTDTHLGNELAERAFRGGLIPSLPKAKVHRREPRSHNGCRLDFVLRDAQGECFVEVKSAMVADGVDAQFPDSVSPRATEHLQELTRLAKRGKRAYLLFVIQRGDVERLVIKCDRDPTFALTLRRAMAVGVQILAVKHNVTVTGFGIPTEVPVKISDS